MTLHTNGPMSLSDLNIELGRPATAQISLNEQPIRDMFGVSSGAMSLNVAYGKTKVTVITLSDVTTNYVLNPSKVPGYVAGIARVELVVNNVLGSVSSGSYALEVNGFTSGDFVKITNNSYIVGRGGDANGGVGGPAIRVQYPVTFINNGVIGGGGNGGSAGANASGIATSTYHPADKFNAAYYSYTYAYAYGGGGGGGAGYNPGAGGPANSGSYGDYSRIDVYQQAGGAGNYYSAGGGGVGTQLWPNTQKGLVVVAGNGGAGSGLGTNPALNGITLVNAGAGIPGTVYGGQG